MKNLPLSIQSIEKLISGNCIYVDKTSFIYNLVTTRASYFLSRPRRFGKSLLLSTMEEIFKGNKELFKNTFIYVSDYSWKVHPVIHLNFAKMGTFDPKILEQDLIEEIVAIGKEYGKALSPSSALRGIVDLIESLAVDNKVVLLVDEYDKPITDHLDNMEVAKANQRLLQEFFNAVKNLDEHLQFVFVTGVSKFAQGSLFSGCNNLIDLTMNSTYADLVGYTEEEILVSFQEYLQKAARDLQESVTEVMKTLREWYNAIDSL